MVMEVINVTYAQQEVGTVSFDSEGGSGALEYTPATKLRSLNASNPIEIASLVVIAQEILDARGAFSATTCVYHSESWAI
ncbi:hypothetical protein [Erwinia sp. S59]|uniref:hypothetical protein n=1 Tax=Erwinia sp. S59 TaxID=2769340 RepID=UPI00190D69B5|nr:hypothetical protein [Erwinia sp. S59]